MELQPFLLLSPDRMMRSMRRRDDTAIKSTSEGDEEGFLLSMFAFKRGSPNNIVQKMGFKMGP